MKSLIQSILLALTLISCSKSTSDVKPDAVSETNLIGTWEALNAYPSANGSARRYYEFKPNKTLTVTNQYAIGTPGTYSTDLYQNASWSIEGTILRIQSPGTSTCYVIILPAVLSASLTCKYLNGSQPCTAGYSGIESYTDLTLAKQ